MPNRFIGINGGIQTLDEAVHHLNHVDGVMLGRAAYHTPGLLADADAVILWRGTARSRLGGADRDDGRLRARHIAAGGRLAHVTRHMAGLFHGLPGARRYRQILSTEATGRRRARGAARRVCGGGFPGGQAAA